MSPAMRNEPAIGRRVGWRPRKGAPVGDCFESDLLRWIALEA